MGKTREMRHVRRPQSIYTTSRHGEGGDEWSVEDDEETRKRRQKKSGRRNGSQRQRS